MEYIAKVDDNDIGNTLETLRPINDAITISASEIISNLSPTALYESFDVFTRVKQA